MDGQAGTREDAYQRVRDELCVEWGFCIPGNEADRIASSAVISADLFVTEFLIAGGWILTDRNGKWYVRIRNRFVERFGEVARAEGEQE